MPLNLDSCIAGVFTPGNIGASSGLPPIERTVPSLDGAAPAIEELVSASDTPDAFFGELLHETASASDSYTSSGGIVEVSVAEAAAAVDAVSLAQIFNAAVGEVAPATDAPSVREPGVVSASLTEAAVAADAVDWVVSLGPPLDAVASVTGAWSLGRNMLTSFGAGTRYTKSGTAIITLEDQSGNNRDLTDSGFATRQPTETTAFPASVLCADFDGSLNWLTGAAISSFFAAGSGAMVVSVIIDAVSTNDAVPYNNSGIMANNGGYMGLHARNLSGVTFYAFNFDGSEDASSTTGAVGTAYVLMWRHHGGNIYISINGGAEISVASGNTASMAGVLLLGRGSGSTFCNMKFAEGFATSDGSQTAALATAIANMKTYIGA